MKVYVGTRALVAKTCTLCGVLKMAEEFGWVLASGTYYRNSSCKRCNQLVSCKSSVEANHASRATARNDKEPWTDEDVDKMFEMTEEGRPVEQIARTLGRTRSAVYTMRNKLKEN